MTSLSVRWEQLGLVERLRWRVHVGLLFRGYETATETPWTSYSVYPSKLVSSGKLGTPAAGLTGVRRESVQPSVLRVGDVIYLLLEDYEIPDETLWVDGDSSFWPWHAALYVGDGVVIHAAPGNVVIRQLLDELRFDALLVMRFIGA